MDIQIIEDKETDTQVIIQCRKIDDEVLRLKNHIELFDHRLQARKEHEWYLLNASDVLYFESVDNRTFLYTANDVMEIRQRLYELEDILPGQDFIRTSKSQIININHVKSLRPEINRTIKAELFNGEKLSVSRKYVPALRKLLSI